MTPNIVVLFKGFYKGISAGFIPQTFPNTLTGHNKSASQRLSTFGYPKWPALDQIPLVWMATQMVYLTTDHESIYRQPKPGSAYRRCLLIGLQRRSSNIIPPPSRLPPGLMTSLFPFWVNLNLRLISLCTRLPTIPSKIVLTSKIISEV